MPETDVTIVKKKKKGYVFIMIVVPLLAFLGAAGIGFQNFSAFSEVLVMSLHLSTGNAFALAIVAGGICSTVVNFCLNAELLHNFYKRITKKPLPALSTAEKFQYSIGMFVFIITGILFGLTAFSVAGAGGLSALGWSGILAIAVGVFVSIITIFQELETWLESFDNVIAIEIYKKWQKLEQDKDNALNVTAEVNKLLAKLQKLNETLEEQALNDKNTEIQKTLKQLKLGNKSAVIAELKKLQTDVEAVELNGSPLYSLEKWLKKLNIARFIGFVISLGNVMALSLLFTIGLTTFLTHLGVAALLALIIGFSVAFTAGAFTEFYFYQGFLTNFCDNIEKRWKDLFNTKNWGVGVLTVAVNGMINAVLAYFGVQMLETLFLSAGIAVPALLPLAIVSAVFAGLASLLLGTDFWIRNSEKFASWFGGAVKKASANKKEDGQPLLETSYFNEAKNEKNSDNFFVSKDSVFSPAKNASVSNVLGAAMQLQN
jgi:hypothetical protein